MSRDKQRYQTIKKLNENYVKKYRGGMRRELTLDELGEKPKFVEVPPPEKLAKFKETAARVDWLSVEEQIKNWHATQKLAIERWEEEREKIIERERKRKEDAERKIVIAANKKRRKEEEAIEREEFKGKSPKPLPKRPKSTVTPTAEEMEEIKRSAHLRNSGDVEYTLMRWENDKCPVLKQWQEDYYQTKLYNDKVKKYNK